MGEGGRRRMSWLVLVLERFNLKRGGIHIQGVIKALELTLLVFEGVYKQVERSIFYHIGEG
jgi:hypothetical protein